MAHRNVIKGTKGNDNLTGTEGRDKIVSGNGDDAIDAGAGNDLVKSGKGNDTVDGGSGNDNIYAGKGDDTVTGGAGDDCVHLGKGNDTAIYVMSNNTDSEDFYHGGKGQDTLRLEFTKEEWLRADIQADIAAYLAYLSGDDVPDEYWHNRSTFEFNAFNLTAKQFENLEVVVDGVTLDPTDEAVDAIDDGFMVTENSTISGNVLTNDDVPDLVASVVLVDDVTKGNLTFNPDGTFTYDTNGEFDDLAVGESTTQTFTYKVIDADGDEDIATATITITGENDAPVVSVIDGGTTNEDASTVTIDLLSTATDPDSSDDLDTESVMVSSSNSGRTVLFLIDNETGSFSLDTSQFNDLAVGESETLTVSYNVTDGNGGVTPNTATLLVEGRNDAPVVSVIDGGTTDEDAATVTIDLLSTATDADGSDDLDTESVMVSSSNSGRTVLFLIDNETGSFSLDPSQFNDLAVGDSETLTVSYNVTDGNGGVTPNTATLLVEGRNDAPVVSVIDGGTTNEDASTVTIDLLSTATDPDSSDDLDTDGVMVSSSNASRTVLFLIDNETGSFSLDPNQFNDLAVGESETLTVSYNITDGNGGVTPNTSTLLVEGRNDAPVITVTNPDPVLEGNFDLFNPTATDIQTVDVFAQTSIDDPDTSDTQNYVQGSISLAADASSATMDLSLLTVDQTTGEVSYDRNKFNFLDDGESAIYNVTYQVKSGPDIVTETIAITILGENDAPTVTGALEKTEPEDGSLATLDLLSGASDVEGDTLTIASLTAPLPAGLSLSGSILTIDPSNAIFQHLAVGDSEIINLSYDIEDGNGGSVAQTAKITITGTNDLPEVAAIIEKSANEDDASFAVNLLQGASDPDDGETATLSVANVPPLSFGLSLSGNEITVDPSHTAFQHLVEGIDEVITINYDIKDVQGGSVAQTAKITITGTNDLPEVAAIIEKSANEDDASFAVNLLQGASDPDDGETATLSVANVPPLSFGLSLSGNEITVDPSHTAFQHLAEGIDEVITVNYDIMDAQGGLTPQTATITIKGKNDLPEVSAEVTAAANEDDASFAVNLLQGASDPDDGETATLSVANVTGLADGLVLAGNGVTVDPSNAAFQPLAQGVQSTITLTYDIVDAQGGTVAQTAKITITGINDDPQIQSAVTSGSTEDDTEQTVDLLPTGAITDIDTGDVLSVVGGTLSQTGGRTLTSAQLNGNSLTYTPNEFNDLGATESESLTFIYNVTDSKGGTVTQTLNLTIEGINDAPVTTAIDAGTVGEDDAPILIDLLQGQTDPDANDTLSIANIVAVDENNDPVTFTNNNDGTITIDPNQYDALNDGENRVVTVTYDVADGTTATQNTANLEVIGATDNLPPDAVDDVLAPVSEFLVNEFTNDSQLEPSITALSTGGFVVTWYSFDPQQGDTSGSGIKARIFNADGTETVSEFLVNEFTNGSQNNPSITALSNGGFVVTWTSQDPQQGSTIYFDIKARIFDATGTETVSEFLVNEFTNNSQFNPSITALSNGGFVVTWSSNDPQQGDTSSTGIKARIFDASGTETVSEFLVNEFTNSHQNNLSITALSNGGFVVTWYSNDPQQGDTSGSGIKARIFDATGTETVSEFLVNEFTNSHQNNPSITALSNGGFVVTWYSFDPQQGDTSGSGIKARIFNADGTEAVSEFLVNEFTNGNQLNPSITALSTGGFVVTWRSDNPQQGDTSSTGIKARIFDANGNPQSSNIFLEDQIGAIQQADLLANDTDPDGDTLTITEVSATSANGATVTLNNDGTISYDPTSVSALQSLGQGETTTDTFTYTITDGNGEFDTATVTVTVLGQNDNPDAIDDAFAVNANEVLTITAQDGVLQNDTDVDTNDTLIVGSFEATSALGATVTVNQDGSLSYDATGVAAIQALGQGITQDDTFTYTIEDGNGGADTATVTVTVTGVNDAPVAMTDDATVDEDGSVLIDVLANDSDVDGDMLSITNITAPANGTAVLQMGQILYTPDPDFSGDDSFTYTIDDGAGGTDTQTVTLTVNVDADTPIVTASLGSTPLQLGTPVALTITGILADMDGSEQIIEYRVDGLPEGATLNAGVVQLDGSVILTPAELSGLELTVSEVPAFRANLDLGALNGSNGFTLNGIDAGDNSGFSVSGAGDINGDGIDDLIIGVPNGDTEAGESYVVFGQDTVNGPAFGASLDLGALNGSNGFTLNGIDAGDLSGWSVSGAGDINGDGIDDLIIGASFASPNGDFKAGESYVVFGQDTVNGPGFSASLDLGALNGGNGFTLNGIDGNDRSGFSVSGAGDINGDGIDDLIIGAIFSDFTGESYVVFGQDTVNGPAFGASLDLGALNGSNGFTLNGIDANDQSGYSVTGVGDINGDGIDDLIIGAVVAGPNGVSQAGESYVVFGQDTVNGPGFSASLDLSTLNGSNGFTLNGIDVSDLSGYSVSGAGDINGDGIDDLIIGARLADPNGVGDAGESYVVFGQDTVNGLAFGASVDLGMLNGSNGFTLNGIDANDGSGFSVSGAGDINGDGIDDLIIGAWRADPNGGDAGESYVVFGQDTVNGPGFSASLDLSTLNGSNGFTLNGIDANDLSGFSVSGAGDINGDGIDDLIIGARLADPNGIGDAGESYVVFGRQGLTPDDFQLTIEAKVEDINPDNAADTHTADGSSTLDVEVNQVPDAVNDLTTVNEDGSVMINVLANDSDVDGDTLSIANITDPDNGTAVLQAGQILYTPDPDFSGRDRFVYQIEDEFGIPSVATVTVNVAPDADMPTLEVTAPEAVAGMAFFDEFTVNKEITSTQDFPQVMELSDGRVLFTWRSFDPDVDGDGSGISARIGTVQADGSITWAIADEFTVNEEVANFQDTPQVMELNDGRVLFTWYSDDPDVDGDGAGISVRIGTVQIDGSIIWAVAGEFTVNEEVTSLQFSPKVAELNDGRVLFTWHSNDQDVDGSHQGISARIGTVQVDGSIVWDTVGEFTVNEEISFGQLSPEVTELSDGRVLFTWDSNDPDVDGSGLGISARIGTVQADGSIAWATAGEFTVNEEITNNQLEPQVTELNDGRVLFTWYGADPDVDGSSRGISARIGTVQSDGSVTWDVAGEFTVNEEVILDQSLPQVLELSDGRVLFTWRSFDPDVDGSGYGISTRIGTVQVNGSIAWDVAGEFTVNEEVFSSQLHPQVMELTDGRVLFTWTSNDTDVDGNNSGISARILELNNGSREDTPIDINILTEIFDTDGSETLSLTLSGFPAGATFSLGSLQGSDWVIEDAAEIASLSSTPLVMTPPLNYNGSFDLVVTATVTDRAVLTIGVVTDTASVTQTHTLTIAPVNDAPEINGWDAQITGKFGVLGPQIIDANATISDAELDLLNGGLGNYDGSSLTLHIERDIPGGIFGYQGVALAQGFAISVNGVDVGDVTDITNLSAIIEFNENATSAAVDQVLQSLTYAPAAPGIVAAPQAIFATFDDGNTGLQGSGGAQDVSDDGVTIRHIPVTTPGLFGKQLFSPQLGSYTVGNGIETVLNSNLGQFGTIDISNDTVFVDITSSFNNVGAFSITYQEVNNDFTDIIAMVITDGAPGWGVSYSSNSFTLRFVGGPFNAADDFGVKLIFAPTDPLVLDLGPEGVHFTPLETAVNFDINADGILDQTAWTTGEDGLLVMDLDGSGAIEDGSELFSPIFGDDDFADSVEALASLDTNEDGIIDENDDNFADILVWQDINSDGISQEGELKSLSEHNIASIDLNAFESDLIIDDQSIISKGGYSLNDGTVREYVAVDFNHIEGGETSLPDDNPSDTETVVIIDDFIIA